MRVVRIQVTPELFFEQFPFPIGTCVVSANIGSDGLLEFVLSHDSLPEVADSEDPPMASPRFRREMAVFDDWGIVR